MALSGVAWLWFVNLFNFMDGIDGLAGSETAAIGLGAVLLASIGAVGVVPGALGLVLVGAALGFLLWNWQPAKIFLGDVGSIPLGYLIGWLLLALAAQGHWVAALLLPGYYLADASLTLARRLMRGERIWQAHREHFYQHAVRQGRSHAQVVLAISITNGGLLILALISTIGDAASYAALAGGAVLVSVLLWYLRASRGRAIDPNET
jgi:UDP-N-acetylmuramyl pentapeptide phosphotransferase/UDP-N-acetylglucosamine-1-phosphate transferase